ncbi:MAG: YqaJ viral recombinase family protein [Gammaproteobacteria bacterium]|nr:YqaJ viral recombinase family protein [Gammaproteobacteria bacterium]
MKTAQPKPSYTILKCEQGSGQWLAARKGMPTGSRFGDIITSAGKASQSQTRQTYMMELLGERLTGSAQERYVNPAMERGTALEPSARAWYEMTTGNKVRQVGFVLPPAGRVYGVSPDGLVNDNSGLEIKCPLRRGFLSALLADKVPGEHLVQIHAGMWICEREEWDFVMYTEEPNLPNMLKTVQRDERIIAGLAEHVPAFCAELDEREAKLRKMYDIPKPVEPDLATLPDDWRPF